MKEINRVSKACLVQSNKITRARCEFSVIERRIIYCIIRSLQDAHKKDNRSFMNEAGQYRDVTLSIDLKSLAICGDKLPNVKEAAMRLKDRSVEIDRDGIWTYVSLFNYIQYNPETQVFRLQISQMILPEYIDLVANFTMYDFAIALHLKSIFSQRFYELCNQHRSMGRFTISVDEIRRMFGIEDKYKRTADINKHVILRAQTEIMELHNTGLCDIYFTYSPSKKNGKEIVEYLFEIHTKMSDSLESFNTKEACLSYIRQMLDSYSGNDRKYTNRVIKSIREDEKLTKEVAIKISSKIKEYSKSNPKEVIGAIIRVCLSQDFHIG